MVNTREPVLPIRDVLGGVQMARTLYPHLIQSGVLQSREGCELRGGGGLLQADSKGAGAQEARLSLKGHLSGTSLCL